MRYSPENIIRSYTQNAEIEERAEKERSLRVEIPREFIKRYIQPNDVALDAGGGAGINAILMARMCHSVTLLDLTPEILKLARKNLKEADLENAIRIIQGDICDLGRFDKNSFTFVVCVGDALSYVLDQREKAISELVRVAKRNAILLLGVDSKYGFLRLRLAQGKIDEAWQILETSETYCGMGPRTHLYSVSEMEAILERSGCKVLEVASTPSLAATIDLTQYAAPKNWEDLKALELEICTKEELLGIGEHLLFVVRKE